MRKEPTVVECFVKRPIFVNGKPVAAGKQITLSEAEFKELEYMGKVTKSGLEPEKPARKSKE